MTPSWLVVVACTAVRAALALDAATWDRAGDPPPSSLGSGAAGTSRLSSHSPINAHQHDYLHRTSGPPGATGVVPPPRMHATLTAVPGGNLFLFGGTAASRQADGSMFLNDAYLFDTSRGGWSDALGRPWCCDDNALVDALGPRPSPRTQHAAAGDGAGRVFVFGGMTDRAGFSGDSAARAGGYMEFEAAGGSAADASARGYADDPTRATHGAGGHGDPLYMNDLHAFDSAPDLALPRGDHSGHAHAHGRSRWSGRLATSGRPPSPRASHTMVLLAAPARGTAAAAAAAASSSSTTATAPLGTARAAADAAEAASHARQPGYRWAADAAAGAVSSATSPGRSGVGASGGDFGRAGSGAANAGTWPSGPAGSAAALYVFGGRSGSRLLNDVHRLDLRTLSWTQVPSLGTPPSPRHFFASCATPDASALVVFGGLWQAVAGPHYPTPDGLRTFESVTTATATTGLEEKPGSGEHGDPCVDFDTSLNTTTFHELCKI